MTGPRDDPYDGLPPDGESGHPIRAMTLGRLFTARHDDDDFLAREEADRALERGDSPRIWLGPTKPCPDCGYLVREVEPGHWICPCHEWSGA